MTFQVFKSQTVAIADDFSAAVEKYRQDLLLHRFSHPARLPAPAQSAILEVPGHPAVRAEPAVRNKLGKILKPAVRGKKAKPMIPGRAARAAIPGHDGTPRPTAHPLIEACVRRVPQPKGPDDFVVDYIMVDDLPPPQSPLLILRQKKDVLFSKITLLEKDKLDALWPPGKRRLQVLNQNEILAKGEKTTDEEKKILLEFKEMLGQYQAIEKRAAVLFSEIEDLTEENIDSWSGTF